jgi:hypothetical protein
MYLVAIELDLLMIKIVSNVLCALCPLVSCCQLLRRPGEAIAKPVSEQLRSDQMIYKKASEFVGIRRTMITYQCGFGIHIDVGLE